jgi:hypothetical protein
VGKKYVSSRNIALSKLRDFISRPSLLRIFFGAFHVMVKEFISWLKQSFPVSNKNIKHGIYIRGLGIIIKPLKMNIEREASHFKTI